MAKYGHWAHKISHYIDAQIHACNDSMTSKMIIMMKTTIKYMRCFMFNTTVKNIKWIVYYLTSIVFHNSSVLHQNLYVLVYMSTETNLIRNKFCEYWTNFTVPSYHSIKNISSYFFSSFAWKQIISLHCGYLYTFTVVIYESCHCVCVMNLCHLEGKKSIQHVS